jgi:hypothetical protein
MKGSGSDSKQLITDLDREAQRVTDITAPNPEHHCYSTVPYLFANVLTQCSIPPQGVVCRIVMRKKINLGTVTVPTPTWLILNGKLGLPRNKGGTVDDEGSLSTIKKIEAYLKNIAKIHRKMFSLCFLIANCGTRTSGHTAVVPMVQ